MTDLRHIFIELSRKKNVVIAGDFNLVLLKFRQISYINYYLESFFLHNYIPKITFPTRLTHRHDSLIDNLIVKHSGDTSNTTSGIILDSDRI